MRNGMRWAGSLGLLLALGSCTSNRIINWSERDPDLRLDWLLALIDDNARRGTTCQEIWRQGNPTHDCNRILKEVEGLAMEFPSHARVLMASALLAYEAGQVDKTRYWLDTLIGKGGVHPDAAVLRARIAIADGNLPFARKLIENQVLLAPDHGGLREVMGAALYLQGDYEGARASLALAAHLGAPTWRVAYHDGLIAEAQGDYAQARLSYVECLNGNPNFEAAVSRLLALNIASGEASYQAPGSGAAAPAAREPAPGFPHEGM